MAFRAEFWQLVERQQNGSESDIDISMLCLT